ncbi:nucleic acid-binding domain protein [Oesophagostomum dentatum]|uniref:Nucleic acid-binding domain protein n=1 Tax=Oesophagostomum dentatum TaxID=61180 RepID=A0A0B1TQ38_OESDE|nr:nucleic acid-binding domain protein [Oesophagostomum dentatum]
MFPDFLGIITEDKIYDVSHADHPLILKVADRYGEFIPLEMPSSSVPSGLSRGSVVSVEGALIKRWQGTISLVVTDSTFVDLEPHDPEADCLRRLFSTGLFDLPITEETFSFTSTTLRLIARLDEYSWEPSTVMARISSINPDNLVYLGCTACKVLAELVDFSGAVTVSLTDDAAKKLMGQPAGAMLKLTNEQLRSK